MGELIKRKTTIRVKYQGVEISGWRARLLMVWAFASTALVFPIGGLVRLITGRWPSWCQYTQTDSPSGVETTLRIMSRDD